MKIRRRFKIKGETWRVRFLKRVMNDGVEVWGLACHNTRTISIKKDLTEAQKRQVFLHELMHASLIELHVREASGWNGDLEEIISDGMAHILDKLFTLTWKRAK